MSGYVNFSNASAANLNLNNNYEALGFGASGGGTTITAGSTENSEGSYVSLGVNTANWAGFALWLGPASTSSVRFLVTVSIGGVTVLANNLFALPSTNAGWLSVHLPLNVPSGSDIQVKVRSSGGLATLLAAIVGVVRNAQSPPCFTSLVALNADTTNTLASPTNTPTSNTWTAAIASSAAAYDALMVIASGTGNTSAAPQNATIRLATGAASSEVEFFRLPFQASTTAPTTRAVHALIQKSFASGVRFSAAILAATTTDNGRVGLYGLTT